MTESKDNSSVVELMAPVDSRVTDVTVFMDSAQVTRIFGLSLQPGRCKILLSGLPQNMVRRSVRVEGRGTAFSIHDIVVGKAVPESDALSASALAALILKESRLQKAREACTRTLGSRDQYSPYSDQSPHLDITCSLSRERLEKKILDLEQQLEEVGMELDTEQERLLRSKGNEDLSVWLEITLSAEKETLAEFIVTYVTYHATWKPHYDIAITHLEPSRVGIVYKAEIKQTTGEPWENATINLSTSRLKQLFGQACLKAPTPGLQEDKIERPHAILPESTRLLPGAEDEDIVDAVMDDSPNSCPVEATYPLPGSITVLGDGSSCSATLLEYPFEAIITWIAIPVQCHRSHVTAHIANSSTYALLEGPATVYINGNYASAIQIPYVKPGGYFECSLGSESDCSGAYLYEITNSTSISIGVTNPSQ
ncbi:hypothetical protein AX16_007544 [Volvariella volvacea WC 439]|nr:hypothetical protein AX16_007544 [Volvariella volvacea WC 439]